MTPESVGEILRGAFMTAFWLGLPLLAVGFIAGVIVSLVQIVTSLQDPSIGAIPRLAAFLGAILLFLPWMLARLMSYTTNLFGDLGRYAR
jgi:flagellar biosynthetic protein FliQ